VPSPTRAPAANPPPPIAAAPPVPPPDPLIEESRLLQSALHALRALHDGEGALSVLDTYAHRFPRGQLRAEATLARVDALLLLERPAEALARLQELPATDRARLPRGRELQVLELELLAQTGRCGEALARLKTFRPRASEPLFDERALFVRATCEARAARVEEARALYEELLRRWPEGAHAAEARRALGLSP
jgi:tetratricopeptide (TPR) repeat protein